MLGRVLLAGAIGTGIGSCAIGLLVSLTGFPSAVRVWGLGAALITFPFQTLLVGCLAAVLSAIPVAAITLISYPVVRAVVRQRPAVGGVTLVGIVVAVATITLALALALSGADFVALMLLGHILYSAPAGFALYRLCNLPRRTARNAT